MTNRKRLLATFLSCGMLFLSISTVPISFAQQETDEPKKVTLKTDEILGGLDEDEETLSRLVSKSAIADLEFLNKGVAPDSIDQLRAMQDHVASLYERVEPAVVNIRSGSGQGSGVVVTSDGYVLTAAHVISTPNRSAVITFPDGTRARAQTLGLFRDLDAGILRIYEMIPSNDEDESDEDDEDESDEDESDEDKSEDGDEEESDEDEDKADDDSDKDDSDEDDSDEDDSDEDEDSDDADEEKKKDEDEDEEEKTPTVSDRFKVQDDLPSFSYLEIGDSDILNLGQWVIAVGHPGGLDEDRGIVLRVGRINAIEKGNYLRTDCLLVGGDSGGPLIGMDGSVIGIHSRIGRRLRENFHVPSTDFVNNWSKLLEPVVFDRDPVLNVRLRADSNVIESIPPRSRARRFGFKESDRIIRIGDKEIYDKLQFDDAISELKPHQVIEFEVVRKGNKKQVINVVIGEKSRAQNFGR